MSSGLRQVKKEGNIPEADVEAQKEKEKEPLKSPTSGNAAFAAASSPAATGGVKAAAASHNPVLLAKVILAKVVDLLLNSDEEDLTQPGGIITLLKDIILGVILGVLTISILIFLDHRGLVHFQSAHNFRNAAFQMLNDPETIQTLEESSDLKFMTLNEYNAKKTEIDSVAEKLKKNQEVLDKRTTEAEAKKAQVVEVKTEWDKMWHNPLLELDSYCGSCHWGMKFSCDGRVQFLQDTYNTRPIQAKISAMGHASCKKKK